MFYQCWINVGPPSTTLAQHKTTIGSISRTNLVAEWSDRQDLSQIAQARTANKLSPCEARSRKSNISAGVGSLCGTAWDLRTTLNINNRLMEGERLNYILTCVTWGECLKMLKHDFDVIGTPVNTTHLYNICTMSDQRRRSWADIVQMLYICCVLNGTSLSEDVKSIWLKPYFDVIGERLSRDKWVIILA